MGMTGIFAATGAGAVCWLERGEFAGHLEAIHFLRMLATGALHVVRSDQVIRWKKRN